MRTSLTGNAVQREDAVVHDVHVCLADVSGKAHPEHDGEDVCGSEAEHVDQHTLAVHIPPAQAGRGVSCTRMGVPHSTYP